MNWISKHFGQQLQAAILSALSKAIPFEPN